MSCLSSISGSSGYSIRSSQQFSFSLRYQCRCKGVLGESPPLAIEHVQIVSNLTFRMIPTIPVDALDGLFDLQQAIYDATIYSSTVRYSPGNFISAGESQSLLWPCPVWVRSGRTPESLLAHYRISCLACRSNRTYLISRSFHPARLKILGDKTAVLPNGSLLYDA